MKYLWHLYKICKDFEFSVYMKSNKVDSDDIYPNSTLTIDELIRPASNMFTLYTCQDNYL